MEKVKQFLVDNLVWLVLLIIAGIITIFLCLGTVTEDGTITLNGKPAEISAINNRTIPVGEGDRI